MNETKKILWTISPYNPTAAAEKLEELAEQGWMLEKIGNLFWTFRRSEPKKLAFAVTYFPGASDFDPDLTEGEKVKAEFCAEDGWILVGRFDIVHIYANENPDAVPVDTDPATRVNTIWTAMKKRVLPAQISMAALIVLQLTNNFSQFQRDPAGYLSDPFYLFSLPTWGLLLLLHLGEILSCLIWKKRAEKSAEGGLFLPIRSSPLVGYTLLGLALVCMVLSYTGVRMSSRSMGFALLWMGALFVILVTGNLLKAALKKLGWSRRANQILSLSVVLVMTLAFFVGVTAAIFSGNFSFRDRKEPIDTVYLDGWTMEIYDDPLPLTVEDLRDTGDVRWSKEATHQESFLLTHSTYYQNNIPDGERTSDEAKDLQYAITEVKIPFLVEPIRKAILHARQDDRSRKGEVIFTDHFEPIDPTLWGADEAYQLHWSDTVLDTYLVCWGNRIAEIRYFWEADEEDIRRTAELLREFAQ